MKEMKDELDTRSGYLGELPVQVVTLTAVNDGKHELATKEMKDDRGTCSGYFGEPPVQVVSLRVSMTTSKNWR